MPNKRTIEVPILETVTSSPRIDKERGIIFGVGVIIALVMMVVIMVVGVK